MHLEQANRIHPGTILLVDDEVQVVNALRRILYPHRYKVLTATNGYEAILMLESHDIDVIVSDAVMDDMDGITLLKEVNQEWPLCVRILLTGQANTENAIEAINEGQIYRYLTKPWNNEEFCAVIAQGLAYRFAELERRRLLELTQQQNAELTEVNKGLEQRVQERTADIEQSYVTATEVFSSLINQRLPISRQTNREVIALVQACIDALELPTKLKRDLEMAAALYNVGKLTWDDSLISTPADQLNRVQRETYRRYPTVGEQLLIAMEHAQEAALYIRHHKERWDGDGYPNGLSGEDIPWGARLLALAVTTVEMQKGMIQPRPLSRQHVLKVLELQAGSIYDPELTKAFIRIVSTIPEDIDVIDSSIKIKRPVELKPGMVTGRKLYSKTGTLLLNEGQVLGDRLIDRLIEIEQNDGEKFKIYIRRPTEEENN